MFSPRFVVGPFALSLCTALLIACGGNNNTTTDAGVQPDSPPTGPKCSNGVDDDADGKIDFPNDPGCSSANEDSETDDCPSGPNCPQCSNGIDDDASGQTDYPNDTGCSSAADNDEFTHNPNACGTSLVVMSLPVSNTVSVTFTAASTSTITSPCGGGAGAPAFAYEIHVTGPTTITATTVDTGTTADTVLDLRSAACTDPGSELVCNNDVSATVKASTLNKSVQAGVYYLILEGKDATVTGMTAVLHVTLLGGEGAACTGPADCGDGLVCRVPAGQTAMVCSQPLCNDGIDDDMDNKTDYPNDPGCTSPTDNDETDDCPSGPNCPACGNNIDDDNDGQMDYPADTGCSSASGNSEACVDMDAITALTMPTTMGTLVGAHDDHEVSCVSNTGPDLLYTITVPAMKSLTIDTENSTADTVIALLPSACMQPDLACDDDGGVSTHSSLFTADNLAAGTYILEVDSYDASAPGPFNIHVSGLLAPGASCEPAATFGGAFSCPTTNPCTGAAGSQICQLSICNNGVDDDMDNKIDYPLDPGCTNPDDTDEVDDCPSGPNCPACSNGIDDDNDGFQDYPLDPECASASGIRETACASTEPVATITTAVTMGDTTSATNDVKPSCASSSATALAKDLTYRIDLPAMTQLHMDLTAGFDTVTALYDSTCGGTALSCSDPLAMTVNNLAAGTYYFVVDGYSNAVGPFTINVSGSIAGGQSCESALAQAGAITCTGGYVCGGMVGSRTCQPTQCNDGVDNDADMLMDYPADPGCTSTSDNDETDMCPAGPGCPACANGIDDDGDGAMDYPADASCAAASSTSEQTCPLEQDAVVVLTMGANTGTLVGAHDDHNPSCGADGGVDREYELKIPATTSLTIDTENTVVDTLLSLMPASCSEPSLACDDDGGVSSRASLLTFTNLPGGTYVVAVDAYSSSTIPNTYNLNIAGTLAVGASCEPANTLNGALTCPASNPCAGTVGSQTCQ